MMPRIAPLSGLLLLTVLLAGCAGSDPGLTQAQVQEIVREELAAAPAPAAVSDLPEEVRVDGPVHNDVAARPASEPALTRAEVEEIVTAAIAAIPEPRPGLTADEVDDMVNTAIAAVPSRTAPADYTRFFVDSALARYQTRGLDATLAHYNSAQSIDGQWYVFIIDENDLVIAHPEPERLGLDVKGWVGTDANGYEFGPDMLSATEEGKWVSYVYRNPESGGIGSGFDDVELKNVWVKRHDGLLFASGWYIDADAFTQV
ncbi:MAG: hypothetical protein OXE02_15500, partial [Chloroflexi bacterium]|nr:hypothetical protein [Chloroflexota bacterium]